MQPRYGVLQTPPHQQQQQQAAMDAVCCSSVFSISNPPNQTLYHPHRQHQHLFHHHQQWHQQVPITIQLLQHHHHHHQLQAFQQQDQRLHQRFQQDHQQSTDPFFSLNFKLGLNENSTGNKEAAGFTQELTSSFLHGPHSFAVSRSWNPQEDSAAIKEPIWKLLEKKVINSGNTQCNDNQEQQMEGKNSNISPLLEADRSSERRKNLENKYRLFDELEAIYSRAQISEQNNQTGSGSALTGENSPTIPCSNNNHRGNVDAADAAVNAGPGVDHGSETSIGEEASLRKTQKIKKKKKKRRRRKLRERLGSMTGFFEVLIKQVMDHQECFQRKVLEVIEGMENERTRREESWRRQEVERHNREAVARTHEQALASNREAVMVSYIEKITGQSVNLPDRKSQQLFQPDQIKRSREPMNADSNSRWPKTEVDALIQVRRGLETKFQEPAGLKGPVWEEVSSLMASMGYQRNAKKCKEKWDNINKYFRKAKESGRLEFSLNSKTCSYFDQLDQLYSSSSTTTPVMRLIKSDDEMGFSKLNPDEEEIQENEKSNHGYI